MKIKLLLLLLTLIGIPSLLYFMITSKKVNIKNNAGISTVSFNGTILKVGDEFNFKPQDSCVGDIKAEVAYLDKNTVSLSIIEEQRLDRKYYARNPADTTLVKIENNECIQGYSLCMDAVYSYCFTVNKNTTPYTITYKIESKSTMPISNDEDIIPNEKEIIGLFTAYKERFLKKNKTSGIADLGYMKVSKMEGLPEGIYLVEYVYLGEGGKNIPSEGGFTLAGAVEGKTLIADPGDANYCQWVNSATLDESNRAYIGQDCP